MLDLLRLLFLVPMAYVAAVVAAALVVLTGWFGPRPPFDYAFHSFEELVYLVSAAIVTVLHIGAVALLPAAAAIVAAELFRWRSMLFYLAAGGAIGLIGQGLSGAPGDFINGQLLLPAAGFVGGFVYWLIAGRLAGGKPVESVTATSPPAGHNPD